jgi:hypothetical protein
MGNNTVRIWQEWLGFSGLECNRYYNSSALLRMALLTVLQLPCPTLQPLGQTTCIDDQLVVTHQPPRRCVKHTKHTPTGLRQLQSGEGCMPAAAAFICSPSWKMPKANADPRQQSSNHAIISNQLHWSCSSTSSAAAAPSLCDAQDVTSTLCSGCITAYRCRCRCEYAVLHAH